VKDGKLHLDRTLAFERWLSTLEGKRVTCEIKRFRKNRTSQQNRYYWGVIVDILSKELGYEPDEIHIMLREKFLRIHDERYPDFVLAKSTSRLSTQEFNEFKENIQRWAAQKLGIYIPDPSEGETYQ
jgi:hypothetical protein